MKYYKKIKSFLLLIFVCFLIVGCSQENTNKEETIVPTEDKNKAAVEAVLKLEFTGPNEEYTMVQQNIDKKWDEIHTTQPEGEFAASLPEDSTELVAFYDLLDKTYKPHFMDYAYDTLIRTGSAYSYHYGFTGLKENVRYQMNVSDIKVTQSENENTPKNYEFTAQVEYKNTSDEVTTYQIIGTAILSEVGKIGMFTISDDGGLREKTREDLDDLEMVE